MLWIQSGKDMKIRQQTLQLVSSLSRWCQVREDLLYGFQKCLEGGLEQPLRGEVEAFITRIQGGLSVDEALNLMEKSLQHEHFQDLVTAIRFNFRYRGDLPALLGHLEWQLNRIEEEYTRRKLSHAHDKKVTQLILLSVPVCVAFRFGTKPDLAALFTENKSGPFFLLIGFIFYLISVVTFIWVQKKIRQ